jgi:hypothetical protein
VLQAICLASLIVVTSVATAAERADGYRGVWYMNQPQDDEYRFKYSGGFATYPQQHVPIAVYSREANKTFFTYAGVADDSDHLQNMVSFYDHATGTVPRPVRLLERKTDDAHCNGTLALDDAGHVYVFCNYHGANGTAYVFRSREPYSIDAFDVVHEENFSYSQAWNAKGKGLLWLHTRYIDGRRRNFFATTSVDGTKWSDPTPLSDMGMGSYQISWCDGTRVATALDFHPQPGGLNARTNLYYLETRDFGKTWMTADNKPVPLPLKEPKNAALVRDFQHEGLLVYLKDLAFDAKGNPVVIYITSHGYRSGPAGGPRRWNVARWTGSAWLHTITPLAADHNYDHGSLYIQPNGLWRLIAPTQPGPQPFGTGGRITFSESLDLGVHWSESRSFRGAESRNQTYVRRPLNAHPDFSALWADGDAFRRSESDLYFCTMDGKVFRLPRKMAGASEKPRPFQQ